jgi:hypothetical protein
MKRLLVTLLGLFALVVAAPAAADPPTEFPIFVEFQEVNPCTGETVTFTYVGTAFFHFHESGTVARSERTITTSDGFAGHGTDSFVQNGQVFTSRHDDVLTDASGDRFLVRDVLVVDLSTETVRVDRFELTCLGPA